MNIAYFLIPKNRVAYLYDDFTFRQGLEKMRYHRYTTIPVISRNGQYVGTISEGELLWKLLEEGNREDVEEPFSMKQMERLLIRDIIRTDEYPPTRITVGMEELLNNAMNQNFIPVVDDLGNFIGIVTRKEVIQYFAEQKQEALPMMSMQKIV